MTRTDRAAAVALVAMALSGCADPVCVHQERKYYDDALSRQLARNGVKHSMEADRGICVDAARRKELAEASRQVDGYFNEVATLARDACEERALVDWATREGLRFDVADTVSSSGRAGRMFLIRSFSREEVEANHRRLREIMPTIQQCPKGS
jgi:hypothetical protein